MKRPLVLWKCLVSEKTVNKETLLEIIFSCEQQKTKSGFLHNFLFLHLKSLACLYYKHFPGVHLPCVAISFSSSFQQCPAYPLLPSGTQLCSQCFPSRSVPVCAPAIPLPAPQLCPVFGEELPGYWLGASCSWQRWTVLSLLWQEVTRTLFPAQMWQAWLKLIREVLEVQRVAESTAQGHTESLHPLPGKPCSRSWGSAASQSYKPTLGTQGVLLQHHTWQPCQQGQAAPWGSDSHRRHPALQFCCTISS